MKKICNTCHEEKSIDDFPVVPGCKGNRRPKCKACVHIYQRARNLRLNPVESRPREIAKRLLRDGLKKCKSCNAIKPIAEYWANNRWPNGRSSVCKGCRRDKFNIKPRREEDFTYARLDYDRKYRNQPEVKERAKAKRRALTASTPRIVMQITLRHGLQRRPTENPATVDDLMQKFEAQQGKCAITGITMTWAQGKVLATSISLDRIDHNGGYSADNLRLVCHAINAFRGRMSDAEMLTMARAIVTNMDAKSREPSWHPYVVLSEAS